MRPRHWKSRRTTAILILGTSFVAGPLFGQPAKPCPPCVQFASAVATWRDQLEAHEKLLEEAKEQLQQVEKRIADHTSKAFHPSEAELNNPGYVEGLRAVAKTLGEDERIAQLKVSQETQIVATLRAVVDALEKALEACRRDMCSEKRTTLKLSAGTPWPSFQMSGEYFISSACAACDSLERHLGQLEAERKSSERALDEATSRSNRFYDEGLSAVSEMRQLIDEAASDPGSSGAAGSRAAALGSLQVKLAKANSNRDAAIAERRNALDSLNDCNRRILDLQKQLSGCQKEKCATSPQNE